MSLADPASVPRFVDGAPCAPGIFGISAVPDGIGMAAPTHFCGSPLRVEFLRPNGLVANERARWARLSERAAAGNIFAQDWFMEPALRHCGKKWSLRLAVVRQDSGAWLGVLPLTFETGVGQHPAPSLQSWRADGQAIGTPLVRPGAEKAFWHALLARLDARPGLALGLHCGALPMADSTTLALASLCAEQRRKLHVSNSFSRLARLSGNSADPATVRKHNQQLDALETRLEKELGQVNLVLHAQREDCEPWLAAFLALERAGQEDRAVSTLGSDPTKLALLREVIRHGHRCGALRLASLTAGAQIVAMASWFVADGYGYGLHMTHGKAWRAEAPGRLLMRRAARMFDREAPLLFDSCTLPDASDDPLWPVRRTFCGLAVGIGGTQRRALFDRLMRDKTPPSQL